MDTKVFWKSRTFWLNAGSALVTILESTQFIDVLPNQYEPLAALIVFALNVALRTSGGVALTLREEK